MWILPQQSRIRTGPALAAAAIAVMLAGCSLFPSERYGLAPPDSKLQYKPVGVTPPARATEVLGTADRDKARAELEKAAQDLQAIPPAQIQQ
jgi:hypothetical protein